MKNKILLSIFILLALATIYLLWMKFFAKDNFAKVEFTQFAVENAKEEVTKIFLADRENNVALLEKQKDNLWSYTNVASGKKYIANPNAMNNLIETIEGIRVRNKVPQVGIKNVLRGIGTIGTKVEIYNRYNSKLRTYYIGGPADGGQGTFAVMEGSAIPYVVNIPHFAGTIDTRFNAKEPALRDRAIVRHNTADIEFMQVEYQSPEQRPYSFSIQTTPNYSVSNLFGPQNIDNKKLRKDYVDIYLESFNVLYAEMILYNKELRDSIIRTAAFAKISYKYKNSEKINNFTIYPVINPSYDRGDGQPGLRQKLMRYYVDVEEDKFFLTQDIVMQKLLRPYEYFFDNQ